MSQLPNTILNQEDLPEHLFSIPELDFSDDLLTQRLHSPWFRIGAWSIGSISSKSNVKDEVERISFLLPIEDFASIFENLNSIGSITRRLGKPTGNLSHHGDNRSYSYFPFYNLSIGDSIIEPLVFTRTENLTVELMVNPDLWLFFELKETTPGSGIWCDPPRGLDVVRRHTVHDSKLKIIEVRRDYLEKYLQARQLSLVIGQYRHLHLLNPTEEAISRFTKTEDLKIGSSKQGTKAMVQNWGLRKDLSPPFLQRRLHLWYQIFPAAIDLEAPWAEEPPFDAFTLTFPTRNGDVAPARWKDFRGKQTGTFAGTTCDFMDRVYFKQDVLCKYQGAAGFTIDDDGSVSCFNEWGLVRSTSRFGNEVLCTAIGDFAEGVPFEEWPHWKQHAIERPSEESISSMNTEQPIPLAVNAVAKALDGMSTSFGQLATELGIPTSKKLWKGSLDSMAGTQLKWVYPLGADDSEFLKRATLLSTLVVEELSMSALRNVSVKFAPNLHLNEEAPPRPLGSRMLLQRVLTCSILLDEMQPDFTSIASLVLIGEKKERSADVDLQTELREIHERARQAMAPLAFLYDIRNSGGLAHSADLKKSGESAALLGLPKNSWNRKHFLQLLSTVTESINKVSDYLGEAAIVLARIKLAEETQNQNSN